MTICSQEHCTSIVVAKGMCELHYRRYKRHGHTQTTRPVGWGTKEKHPLYDSWAWIKKMRGRHKIQDSWEDFWNFVSDVGERPSKKHNLSKKDPTLGYTKENLYWKPHIGSTEDRAEYARNWRKANPDKCKNSNLKKMFGISLTDYNAYRERQNNSCAICNKHESEEDQDLSVDHCHSTGKIRGLLCSNCNRAIGLLKDNIENLKKAILYLESESK